LLAGHTLKERREITPDCERLRALVEVDLRRSIGEILLSGETQDRLSYSAEGRTLEVPLGFRAFVRIGMGCLAGKWPALSQSIGTHFVPFALMLAEARGRPEVDQERDIWPETHFGILRIAKPEHFLCVETQEVSGHRVLLVTAFTLVSGFRAAVELRGSHPGPVVMGVPVRGPHLCGDCPECQRYRIVFGPEAQ